MEHGSEHGSKESWSDLVDLVSGLFFGCGSWFDLVVVCGFFIFLPFFLVMVGGDLV